MNYKRGGPLSLVGVGEWGGGRRGALNAPVSTGCDVTTDQMFRTPVWTLTPVY